MASRWVELVETSSVTTNASGAKTASALYRETSCKDKAFGETRFTSGTLSTDYKFTGQREESALGIYWFSSRWFDPTLGRFMSPDTIVPTSTQGTQAWDRYAFVNNNPVRYTDPTGHNASCNNLEDEECKFIQNNQNDGGEGGGTTSTTTSTPTATSTPSATATPAATATPQTPIDTAISWLQDSPVGWALYNMLLAYGFTIQYGPSSGKGSGGSHLDEGLKIVYIYHGATNPADIAGTIAHEAMHFRASNTLLSEYKAFAVGDTVRNDIFQAGHGVASTARHPGTYTLDINSGNPNLATDLVNWFWNNEPKYVDGTWGSIPPY